MFGVLYVFIVFIIRQYHCYDKTVHTHLAEEKLSGVYQVRKRAGYSWPHGVVNYYVDRDSYDNLLAQNVRMGMNNIEAASCIKFKPLMVKPEEYVGNWIHLTNPDKKRECFHGIPMANQETGEINVRLGLDCLKRPQIMHTLLHAVGFPDEIKHPNRDQYVRVQWQNVAPQHRDKFAILDTNLSIPWEYDPQSIMHFHDHAFTKNGRSTVSAILPGLKVAPSEYLSPLDKLKLRISFEHECNKRKVRGIFEECKKRFSANSTVVTMKDKKIRLCNMDKQDHKEHEEHEEKKKQRCKASCVFIGSCSCT